MYVLDTDHLSLLEWDTAESISLQIKCDWKSLQMRGWLERAARADTRERLLSAYGRLELHIKTFEGIPLLLFDENAALTKTPPMRLKNSKKQKSASARGS